MKLCRTAISFSFLFLAACTSSQRHMASEQEKLENEVLAFYEADNLALRFEDRATMAQQSRSYFNPLSWISSWLVDFSQDTQKFNFYRNLRDREWKGIAKDTFGDEIKKMDLRYKVDWREQAFDRFVLHDLNAYKINPDGTYKKFWYSNTKATQVSLLLENHLLRYGQVEKMQKGATWYLQASMTCDKSVSLVSQGSLTHFSDEIPAKTHYSFKWRNGLKSVYDLFLNFSDPVTRCAVTLKAPGDSQSYGFDLIPASETPLARLDFLSEAFEGCFMPGTKNLKPVQQFFFSAKYRSETCPYQFGENESIVTLEDRWEGVRTKLFLLTGQKISDDVIRNQNPFVPLDFSKAPSLDLIVVSYLVFRADFYGTLLAQALEYHAARGTAIRILVSDVIQLLKDRQMLYDLATRYPNVKLQEFHYDYQNILLPKDFINSFHRANHIKIFATVSDKQPEFTQAVIGGRNIHDGFVFEQPPIAKEDRMVQYGKDDSWASWRDFEALVQSQKVTRQLVAHFSTVWDRESSNYFRPYSVMIPSSGQLSSVDPGKTWVRHVISFPYKDESQLAKYYGDLIRSARKKILISTPYFRPVQPIVEALQDAVKRGVEISLITRLDLSGDTADIILSDVNKQGVNEFLGQIKLYEYTQPSVILHSKIIVVDEELSFIGSVNLNKRSFYHDTENGLLILNSAYAQKMHTVLSEYFKQAKEITGKLQVAFWKRIVIGWLDKEL